jgi:cytosine/uracil/thiamine/allantoin permease
MVARRPPRLLDVPDLYRANGRYYGFHGFNPVGLGSLVLPAAIIFKGEFNKSVA